MAKNKMYRKNEIRDRKRHPRTKARRVTMKQKLIELSLADPDKLNAILQYHR